MGLSAGNEDPGSLELGCFLEAQRLPAGHGNFKPAPQLEMITAVRPLIDALDELQVDDLPAIGAKEQRGRQPAFQVIEGTQEQWLIRSEKEPRVIPFRFQQRDFLQTHEPAPVSIADKDALAGSVAP